MPLQLQLWFRPCTALLAPRVRRRRLTDVWLMGVWERSPAGIRIAMGNQGLLDDFRRALPDFIAA